MHSGAHRARETRQHFKMNKSAISYEGRLICVENKKSLPHTHKAFSFHDITLFFYDFTQNSNVGPLKNRYFQCQFTCTMGTSSLLLFFYHHLLRNSLFKLEKTQKHHTYPIFVLKKSFVMENFTSFHVVKIYICDGNFTPFHVMKI